MRRALAPVLSDDEQPGQRPRSPVASARRKALSNRDSRGLPGESFQDWLKGLATVSKTHVQPNLKNLPAPQMITRPTPSQKRALELLCVSL